MKKLKRYSKMLVRSKTNLFAAALAGLSSLQLAFPSFVGKLTPEMYAGGGVVIAMAIAYLRSVTTAPLKDKVDV